MTKTCPACGKTHEAANICPFCGAKVPEEPKSPKPPKDGDTKYWDKIIILCVFVFFLFVVVPSLIQNADEPQGAQNIQMGERIPGALGLCLGILAVATLINSRREKKENLNQESNKEKSGMENSEGATFCNKYEKNSAIQDTSQQTIPQQSTLPSAVLVEDDNLRPFDIKKDMHIAGWLVCGVETVFVLYAYIPEIIAREMSWIIPVIMFGISILCAVWCVNNLRPRVHGNRTFAFTLGYTLGLFGLFTYWLYVIIREYRESKLKPAQ